MKSQEVWEKITQKKPPLPEDTCPLVDIVISLIKDAQTEGEINMAIAYLEKIRSANYDLRMSSYYWYRVAKKALDKGNKPS